MDIERPLRAFDRFQKRRRWLAIPVAVIKKFGDDHGGNLAALVAYYGFFSLFPLLLVFVTILGYVLQGDPNAQRSIEHSVLSQFPVIGAKITPTGLRGHAIALIVGVITSLLSGLGVTQATQTALDQVWAVPIKARPNFIKSRLRGLGLLALLGTLFIVATAASGLVSAGLGGGTLVKVAGIVISLVLNLALFGAAFRLMTAASVPTRCLWIGVVLAGVLWEILQIVGALYIAHVQKKFTGPYAPFGLVIALLVWLHLGAQVTLYAAEVNVVVARHLWPRSLIGPPAAPADEETLRALAKVEERSAQEHIEVEFTPAEQVATGPRTADREPPS